jgi:hypothetical protein
LPTPSLRVDVPPDPEFPKEIPLLEVLEKLIAPLNAAVVLADWQTLMYPDVDELLNVVALLKLTELPVFSHTITWPAAALLLMITGPLNVAEELFPTI